MHYPPLAGPDPLVPLVRGNIVALSPLREHLDLPTLLERYCTAGASALDGLTGNEVLAAPQMTGIRVVVASKGQVLVTGDPHERRLAEITPEDALSCAKAGDMLVLLGGDQGGTLWIGVLGGSQQIFEGLHAEPAVWDSARHGAHMLNDDNTQCAVELTALWHWHEQVRFCQGCGAGMSPVHCGWVRQCDSCSRLEYPRQDPAMIVAVTNERGELLLAHNALWEDKRVSVLAGFVDAGESPQRAVERELWEEVGLRVSDIAFLGSQPWPFPRSLMLGYSAKALDDTLRPDRQEIEWAEWVSPHSLRQAVADGRMILPGVNTIAYGLISRWYGGPLPTAEDFA